MILRDGEVKIISVTPVARGTFRPCVVGIVMLALVIFGAKHVHVIHEHEMLLGLIFAGPFALVALTRTWRWRSHKVHITNERIASSNTANIKRRSRAADSCDPTP